VIATVGPIRTRLDELRRDEAAIDAFLAAGAERAATIAAPILAGAYRAVGLRA
jgi:tryptophanyl-tRNA synthetase